MWQGPDWAWGNAGLEALLSSRTLYGNRSDIEHLRQEAIVYLDDGLKRLDRIAEAVEKVKKQVATLQTYEDFIHPAQKASRHECISSHYRHDARNHSFSDRTGLPNSGPGHSFD